MSLHPGHLAPVELDEPDAARTAEPGLLPAWLRRHAPAVAGATALLVLALLGAQSALDSRERERLTYLADVPGVLSPLHDPPDALWRWAPTAGTFLAGDQAGRWAIGALYHRGGVDLQGTDPDTGDVLWSVPFSLDAALPPGGRSELPSVWVRCSAVAAQTPVAVCAAEVSPVGSVGAATPLVVLDPTDGAVLATPAVAAGSLWSTTGPDLVVATPVPDDGGGVHWTLTATDLATGELAWRRTTPVVPQVHEVLVGDVAIRSTPALTSDDDRVLLTDSGHAWLFGADGAPRGDVTVATDGWAALARADTLVWTPWQTFAIPAGILVTRDGTRVAVGEGPATLAVDDGSAAGTVLLTDTTAGTTLVARDATTGDELWRTDGLTSEPLLVDGAVYLPGVNDVAAFDARTGQQRWRVDVGGVPLFVGTDGTHVVVLTPDRTLRALGMADGRPASVADVATLLSDDPGGVSAVSEYAGRLLIRFRNGTSLVVG
ncbi:outer membrane protein assembly factor BamB family protein [Cellulomonas sp. P5_E12]